VNTAETPTGDQSFTIGHAEEKKTIHTQHGPLVIWKLGLQLGEQKFWPVETKRKEVTPAPRVSDTIYGVLTRGEYGFEFKRSERPQSQNGSAGKDSFERRPENPRNAARMGRAHAQEMALRFLAIRVQTGEELKVDLQRVRQTTDWYAQDVDAVDGEPPNDHAPASNPDDDLPF